MLLCWAPTLSESLAGVIAETPTRKAGLGQAPSRTTCPSITARLQNDHGSECWTKVLKTCRGEHRNA